MQHGNRNVLSGIKKALGSTLAATAKGGNKIIKSVGGAIHDVFDGIGDLDKKIVGSLGDAASKIITTTGGAVKDATTGFGNFFHGILGGIAGTIKWAAILLIVLVLIIANRRYGGRQASPSSILTPLRDGHGVLCICN